MDPENERPGVEGAGCRGCRGPAPLPEGDALLLIAPPRAHTRTAVAAHLRAAGYPVQEPSPELLRIDLRPGAFRPLLVELSGLLTPPELRSTRCLLRPAGAMPALQDLLHMESLDTLAAQLRSEWVAEIVREDRLTAWFQPLVSARDPQEVHAYECLVRGIDAGGGIVPPSALFADAAEAGLLFQLDRAARRACIRAASRQGVGPRLFINFTPNAVYDPVFCLRTTAREVREAGFAPQDVCFEVTESERITDLPHLLGVLDWYRKGGFKVALDDLGSGYSSLNLLSRLRPDYVKLDAELVRGVDHDPYRAGIVSHLLQLARSLGVTTVAEGVESGAEFDWLRARGADLVQGYYFARPAAAPPLSPAGARRAASQEDR